MPKSTPQSRRLDLLMDALVTKTPAKTLRAIVAELHSDPDPDDDFIAILGVGPLETLFHRGFGEDLWPEVEHLARTDARFRQALASVVAAASPEAGRRRQLLEELAETEDESGDDGDEP